MMRHLTAGAAALGLTMALGGTVGLASPAPDRNVAARTSAMPHRQVQPRCLHAEPETTQQRERRLEAVQAIRLIDRVSASVVSKRRVIWADLLQAPLMRTLRNDGGPDGDLARRIRWGTIEPLPGWRIRWVPGPMPVFSLTDTFDPCRFMLSSGDPEVIPPSRRRAVPLDGRFPVRAAIRAGG